MSGVAIFRPQSCSLYRKPDRAIVRVGRKTVLRECYMRLMSCAIAFAVAFGTVLPAGAAGIVGNAPQVIVMDRHVTGFVRSLDDVLSALRSAGFNAGATDLRGRLEQFEAPFADIHTTASLDQIVGEAGFASYSEWVRIARSVLVTENWISHPPETESVDVTIRALKGDPFLSDTQRAKLISALRETVGPRIVRPLGINIETVRPHVANIRRAFGTY